MLTSTKNFIGAILIADLPASRAAGAARLTRVVLVVAAGLARVVVVAAAATSNLARAARRTAATLVLAAADNANNAVQDVVCTHEDALL